MTKLIDPTPQLERQASWALKNALEFHTNSDFDPLTVGRTLQSISLHLTRSDLRKIDADNIKRYETVPRLPLSEPSGPGSAFGALVKARQSVSSGVPLALETIAHLMFLAAKINRTEKSELADGGALDLHRRPYPSAGALFPCEVYLLTFAVNELPTAVYHYDPLEHSLAAITPDTSIDQFKEAFFAPGAIDDAALAIVITGVLERSVRKYGSRGYRFSLLEAGHLSQNICLAATALEINCCPWGGYYDDHVLDLIRPGESEVVLATLLLSGRR